jgi:hypothetical protein
MLEKWPQRPRSARAARRQGGGVMKRLAGCMLILFCCVLAVGGDGSAAPQVKTIAVNGTNVAYIEQGQGPTLVLVHGTLIDYRYWAAQMDPFADGGHSPLRMLPAAHVNTASGVRQ